jgi:diguanylate cyclase (GGDEF)-like protein
MLDLDFFKQVNDTHGHEAGDKVIKTLADMLARSVRSSDIAVRYGGEEFLVVLTDTGIEPALKVAEKIRAEVEAPRFRCRPAYCRKRFPSASPSSRPMPTPSGRS